MVGGTPWVPELVPRDLTHHYPTRLETRTKESNIAVSLIGLTRHGEMKVKETQLTQQSRPPQWGVYSPGGATEQQC